MLIIQQKHTLILYQCMCPACQNSRILVNTALPNTSRQNSCAYMCQWKKNQSSGPIHHCPANKRLPSGPLVANSGPHLQQLRELMHWASSLKMKLNHAHPPFWFELDTCEVCWACVNDCGYIFSPLWPI